MTARGQDMVGKVALVVGCGMPGNSGAASARALCEAGAQVVLADLASSQLDAVTSALKEDGYPVASCTVDLVDEGSVKAMVEFAVGTFGRLDAVANVAAATHLVHRDHGVDDMTAELWDLTFAINIRGPMFVCKYAVPIMIGQGGGAIVNITSGQGLRGDGQNTAYSASKAALDSMTRSIATIYGDKGIRCNSIASGVIATNLMKSIMPPKMVEVIVESTPLGRLGQPEDIADLVAYLLSDRASFITAQTIQCDGGVLDVVPTRSGLRRLAKDAQSLQPAGTKY